MSFYFHMSIDFVVQRQCFYFSDYFRCLKQTTLPSPQTTITPSPSPACDEELALTFCLLATFGTFIVASLAISLFCFLWCKWKKTAPNRNTRGLLVTQTADAQVEQGLIAKSKFAVNELDAQKRIIPDQLETNETLLLANNENSLSASSKANSVAMESDKGKAITEDTKSADSGFISNHAGNSRECPWVRSKFVVGD